MRRKKGNSYIENTKTGERTYVDMLSELRQTVERDSIPYSDHEVIMRHIIGLEVALWPYSA